MFVTLLTCTFQISLGFWETVHLPLSQANIKTHFPLRAKSWLRRRVAGQFPRKLNWSHFFQGVVPEALLKERLDVETLDTLGIIQSQKAFNQKYVRTKTKLLCVYFLDIFLIFLNFNWLLALQPFVIMLKVKGKQIWAIRLFVCLAASKFFSASWNLQLPLTL